MKIESKIGQGSMASVFHAFDTIDIGDLGRLATLFFRVAYDPVKMISTHFYDFV